MKEMRFAVLEVGCEMAEEAQSAWSDNCFPAWRGLLKQEEPEASSRLVSVESSLLDRLGAQSIVTFFDAFTKDIAFYDRPDIVKLKELSCIFTRVLNLLQTTGEETPNPKIDSIKIVVDFRTRWVSPNMTRVLEDDAMSVEGGELKWFVRVGAFDDLEPHVEEKSKAIFESMRKFVTEVVVARCLSAMSEKSLGPENAIKEWYATAGEFMKALQDKDLPGEDLKARATTSSEIDMGCHFDRYQELVGESSPLQVNRISDIRP
jgi:hypothetical protein